MKELPSIIITDDPVKFSPKTKKEENEYRKKVIKYYNFVRDCLKEGNKNEKHK